MHLVFAGDVRYLLPVEQDLSQNPCLVLRFQAATFLSFRFVFFCHKAFPCLEIYTLLALTFSSKLRVSATGLVMKFALTCIATIPKHARDRKPFNASYFFPFNMIFTPAKILFFHFQCILKELNGLRTQCIQLFADSGVVNVICDFVFQVSVENRSEE